MMQFGKCSVITDDMLNEADISKIGDSMYLSGSIIDYNILTKLHIDAVINLKAEQHDDVWELTKRGIAYFWIPVADWGAPRSDQFTACFRIAKEYHNVLIHCAVGKGRSVVMVAAVLLNNSPALPVEDALQIIKEIRPIALPTENQRKKLSIQFPGR